MLILICLEKKAPTSVQRLGHKLHSGNRKLTNHQAKSAKNKPKGYLHRQSTLLTWHHTFTRASCIASQQTHLDQSDQHHTCCTFLRLQANLHSMLHVKAREAQISNFLSPLIYSNSTGTLMIYCKGPYTLTGPLLEWTCGTQHWGAM